MIICPQQQMYDSSLENKCNYIQKQYHNHVDSYKNDSVYGVNFYSDLRAITCMHTLCNKLI